MIFETNRPWYVINRWWERLVADDKGIINTNNQEAIESLTHIFWVEKVENKKKS